MEHQDFTLLAFNLSCGSCPALQSKGFVQIRAGGSEFHKLGLDQTSAGVNTPEVILGVSQQSPLGVFFCLGKQQGDSFRNSHFLNYACLQYLV